MEGRLAEMLPHLPPGTELIGNPESADWIIDPVPINDLRTGPYLGDSTAPHRRARTLTWDAGDFPTGARPGFYCSLDRRLFDQSRHRGWCYLIRYNPFIRAFPPTDATHLWGFTGSITSGLRGRLFDQLLSVAARDGALLRRTTSLFGAMADPKSDKAKAAYADDIRRSQFVLCPRGNGHSSVRLFEVMEAGRVPVIISDALVLPSCVDWPSCSIRISERQLAHAPDIIAARRDDFSTLASAARAEWERCFSPQRLLHTLCSEIATLARTQPLIGRRPRYIAALLIIAAEMRAKALPRLLRRLSLA